MKSLNIYWPFLIIVLSRRGKVRKIRTNQKFHQYGEIFNLASCRNVDRILEWVKVIDIWGVDRKEAFKLKCEGIRAALDLKDADPSLGKSCSQYAAPTFRWNCRGFQPLARIYLSPTPASFPPDRLATKLRTIEPILEVAAFHAAKAI